MEKPGHGELGSRLEEKAPRQILAGKRLGKQTRALSRRATENEVLFVYHPLDGGQCVRNTS